jgi:hypothetical protein
MKKIASLIIALLFVSAINAQSPSKKMFTHEVGVDMYPVLQSIFGSNGGWGGGQVGDFSVMYRLSSAKYGALRLRASSNNSQTDEYSYSMVTGKSTTIYTALPSAYNRTSLKIGWQYGKMVNALSVYAGLDVNIIVGKNKGGNSSNRYDSTNINNIYVNISKNTSTNKEATMGLSPFAGVMYKLNKHLNLSYEFCMNINTVKNKQAYDQFNSSIIYNSQGDIINETKYETKLDYSTKTKTQAIVPVSIFMLSYSF